MTPPTAARPTPALPTRDLRAELGDLYSPPDTPTTVTVPPLSCLMVDGVGDPNTSAAFEDAVGTLYALSYGVRGLVKAAGGLPCWHVMPLEALWWADDMTAFTAHDKARWSWTALIVQPEVVDADLLGRAMAEAVRKRRAPAADLVRLEVLDEGQCLQVMHHGPYADEDGTIAGLHAAIAAAGLRPGGKHHEIYLNDARRTAPEKLRTIVRQPVTRG